MPDALRSLARRLAAYAVDVVILAAVLIPLAFVIQRVVGYRPDTGVGVWLASLATISVPSWLYFTLSDASSSGATLGKRLLGLRAATVNGGRIGLGRALARTAIKLIPWELTHLTFFALSPQLGTFTGLQLALLVVVYGLFAIYLVVALRNRGERSLHDLFVGTAVRRRAAA
jgi:uncharacterized RDD family membrane protein YckC